MRVTKYSDNAPELDTLRETYIYRIAAKVAQPQPEPPASPQPDKYGQLALF